MSEASPSDPFLAATVHELRTPLNSILGFTGTLLMRLPGPLNADQERQLKHVERSARHMLALVDELLEFARDEALRPEPLRETLVLQELVGEALQSLAPLARAKGLELRAELPREPLELVCDRRALTQILLNLAGNALKFTEHGGVRIEAAREAGQPCAPLRIAVIDSGVGIDEEAQARLFRPYERLQQDGPPGSGLGLHLSQRIAERLGGRIRCESAPGRGSRFELYLP